MQMVLVQVAGMAAWCWLLFMLPVLTTLGLLSVSCRCVQV